MYTQLSQAHLSAALDCLGIVPEEQACYAAYRQWPRQSDCFGANDGFYGSKRLRQSIRKLIRSRFIPELIESRTEVTLAEYPVYWQSRMYRGLPLRACPTMKPIDIAALMAAVGLHCAKAKPTQNQNFLVDSSVAERVASFDEASCFWFFTAASILAARFFYETSAWPPISSTWQPIRDERTSRLLAAQFERPSGQLVVVAAIGGARSYAHMQELQVAIDDVYRHAMDNGAEFELHSPKIKGLPWPAFTWRDDYEYAAYSREYTAVKKLRGEKMPTIPWYSSYGSIDPEDILRDRLACPDPDV